MRFKQYINEMSKDEWWDKNKDKFEKMGLRIVGKNLWSPAYFTVVKPIKAYILGEYEETNAYYGNAQIRQRKSTSITLKKGNEIHWLPGGTFLVKKGKVDFLKFSPQKSPFERGGADYSDLMYKDMLYQGKIKINTSPTKISRYPH